MARAISPAIMRAAQAVRAAGDVWPITESCTRCGADAPDGLPARRCYRCRLPGGRDRPIVSPESARLQRLLDAESIRSGVCLYSLIRDLNLALRAQ